MIPAFFLDKIKGMVYYTKQNGNDFLVKKGGIDI